MEVVVAESLRIYVFEISLKRFITVVTAEHSHGLVPAIFVRFS
jgi:hypothetical protein